jgi:hypothetical protein
MPRIEATDMGDRVEIQVQKKLETIVKVSDLFKDLVQAKLSEYKLKRLLMDLYILSCKPNHVSNFEDVGRIFVLFELFFHLFLG